VSISIQQLILKVANLIGEDDAKSLVARSIGCRDIYKADEFLQELGMDSVVPDRTPVGPILVLEHPDWYHLAKFSISMSNLDTVLDFCSQTGLSVRDWILLNSPIPTLRRHITPSMYSSIPVIRNQLYGRAHRYAQVLAAKELFGLCFEKDGWDAREDQWPQITAYADIWVKDSFPGLRL